jgi:predicted DNA-binding protein
MTKKPFQIKLTDEERERLERLRAILGLRSQADVIREWIAKAPQLDRAA